MAAQRDRSCVELRREHRQLFELLDSGDEGEAFEGAVVIHPVPEVRPWRLGHEAD